MNYDDIVARAVSGGIVELFKRILDKIPPMLSKASVSIDAHDIVGSAARQYASIMIQRYGSMRIFGMQHPIPLIDIYTQVNVLENITSQRRMTVDELNKELDQEYKEEFSKIGQRRFGKIRVTRTGIEAFAELDRFVLLGKPGSGKTTFLKHIFLSALINTIESTRIPVIVSLNQAAEYDGGIMGIVNREFSLCGIKNYKEFVIQSLSVGGFILLFDGLDEVREEQRTEIIRQITDISDQYPDNKFVITCRVAAYSYWLERFSNVEIADFNGEQIADFITRWFRGSPETGALFTNALSQNRSLSDLSRTPLLLTIMCLAYAETLSISDNRAEIYRDAVDALLKKWDASRAIKRDTFYKELTLKRKEDLFSYFASETFPKNEFFLKKIEWERYAINYLKNLPSANPHTIVDEAGPIIEAIAAQHGLLVERASGIFSFSHLTFLEYFMARYAVDAGFDYQTNIVRECIAADQWREVIILMACLVNSADHILIALMEAASNYGFSRKPVSGLKLSLQRAAETTTNRFDQRIFNSKADGRPILQVIGGTAEPTLEAVKQLIESRKSKFLPLAIAKLTEKAVRIVSESSVLGYEGPSWKNEMLSGPTKYIPKHIYKELLEVTRKELVKNTGRVRASKVDIEMDVFKLYYSYCMDKLEGSLSRLREVAILQVEEISSSTDARKRILYLTAKGQKQPADLIEARDMIVVSVVGIFENIFKSKALYITDAGLDHIKQQLLAATDLNSEPTFKDETTYLYIAELLYDLLKQPILAKPEVRKALLWTLLNEDDGPNEPQDLSRRMRA